MFYHYLHINVIAQGGQKFATGGNDLSASDRLGSNNYADLNFYTNSLKRMTLTKDGNLNVFGQSRFYKNSVFDSLLTAFSIKTNTLTVINNAHISGVLTVGNTLTFDGITNNITASSGIIGFGNNNLTTTGAITTNAITASSGTITNTLTAGNISATGIQTQTINASQFLINGSPSQPLSDTINLKMIRADNIIIDGPAKKIYSTSGMLDFNGNNIMNIGLLTVAQVGVNITNPIAALQINGTDELSSTIGVLRFSDTDKDAPRVALVRYRGTASNPLPIQQNDCLGKVSFHGFDGTYYSSSEMIKGIATENYKPTGHGSQLEFYTTPNGSINTLLALSLNSDQTAVFYNTVTAPTINATNLNVSNTNFDNLHVNGNVYVGSKIFASAYSSNSPLIFEAPAGTERMRISDINGNVGIGTNNPQTKFHVYSNASNGVSLRLENYLNSGLPIDGYPHTTWDITALAPDKLVFSTPDYATPVMTMTNGGIVGIGTNTPGTDYNNYNQPLDRLKLDVKGDACFGQSDQNFVRIGYNSLHSMIDCYGVDAAHKELLINWYSGGDLTVGGGGSDYSLPATGNFTALYNAYFATNSGNVGIGSNLPDPLTSKIYIKGDGNTNSTSSLNIVNSDGNSMFFVGDDGRLGMGTTTPGYRLDVCGTIRSTEWIVETGWCDFVFDPNYKRMTWQEKEKFYLTYKHLPSISSEKEIKENGLKAGKTMQGMILNIEENSLDIIDIYKENQEQRKQIEELKKENQKLQNDVEWLMNKIQER